MSEQWRPIPGYEGHYEVSSQGRVRSLARYTQGSRHRLLTERVMSPTLSNGYLAVQLVGDGRGKRKWHVHRLVALAFIGPKPDGWDTCHGDGDRLNNSAENLRYDTRRANILDAVAHGTHHLAKLTHCKRGHEFTPENTWVSRRGSRNCRACRRALVAA